MVDILLEFHLMLKMSWSVNLAVLDNFGSVCGQAKRTVVTVTRIVGYGQMELPAPASIVGEMLKVARATIHQTVLLLMEDYLREWVFFSIGVGPIIGGKTEVF